MKSEYGDSDFDWKINGGKFIVTVSPADLPTETGVFLVSGFSRRSIKKQPVMLDSTLQKAIGI